MNAINKPYEYICSWAEDIFPHTGRKVFRILSLMIPSLIIPDIPYKNIKIRSNIHTLFLTPPGAAKSSISQIFSYLTYNPLEVESITPPRLESEIKKTEYGSLIVGDFARMSKDQIVLKILEGILGEDKKISRKTMRGDAEGRHEIIGLLCGVPSDLSDHLTSGLIFRVCPIVIFHSSKEHSEIGKYINDNIGIEEEDSKNNTDKIKMFYEELLKIQTNTHEEIKPIMGYIISDKSIRDEILSKWDILTKDVPKKLGFYFYRELHEGYRFLFSHAFLNVFEREIDGNKLIPNRDDLRVALELMENNIIIKKKLFGFEGFVKRLKSIKDLNKILGNKSIDDTDKGIIKSLAKQQ